MNPLTPSIQGVQIVPLKQIVDQRGAVLHMLRADSPHFQQFGEIYFSEVNPGVVKGWKRHSRMTQFFAVPVGRIKLVIYDGRPGSVSNRYVDVLEIGRPDAYHLVIVPPGLSYGFQATSDVPAILANCPDLSYDPVESETLPLDDKTVPYVW